MAALNNRPTTLIRPFSSRKGANLCNVFWQSLLFRIRRISLLECFCWINLTEKINPWFWVLLKLEIFLCGCQNFLGVLFLKNLTIYPITHFNFLKEEVLSINYSKTLSSLKPTFPTIISNDDFVSGSSDLAMAFIQLLVQHPKGPENEGRLLSHSSLPRIDWSIRPRLARSARFIWLAMWAKIMSNGYWLISATRCTTNVLRLNGGVLNQLSTTEKSVLANIWEICIIDDRELLTLTRRQQLNKWQPNLIQADP